jgi:fermentation-respiration switch protein FrsA (DUF1100 family)
MVMPNERCRREANTESPCLKAPADVNVVARADELRHPILILHSDDDGFVPSDASHALLSARPDLVTMQLFDTARHTKLWNYDQERWTRVIGAWLTEQNLTRTPSAERS